MQTPTLGTTSHEIPVGIWVAFAIGLIAALIPGVGTVVALGLAGALAIARAPWWMTLAVGGLAIGMVLFFYLFIV